MLSPSSSLLLYFSLLLTVFGDASEQIANLRKSSVTALNCVDEHIEEISRFGYQIAKLSHSRIWALTVRRTTYRQLQACSLSSNAPPTGCHACSVRFDLYSNPSVVGSHLIKQCDKNRRARGGQWWQLCGQSESHLSST